MPKANKTRYAILGILSFAPMSGYDIKKLTDFSISNFWHENFGHIYPVLKRMEAEGLVTRTVKEKDGKPDRKVYTITKRGTQALASWLQLPTNEAPIRNEFLLKLFFSGEVPVQTVVENIRKERIRQEGLIEKYSAIEESLKANQEYTRQAGFPLWLSTLKYGIAVSRAVIAWCDETQKSLA
jgi:DNA-binding PadR family transcriptional regulator